MQPACSTGRQEVIHDHPLLACKDMLSASSDKDVNEKFQGGVQILPYTCQQYCRHGKLARAATPKCLEANSWGQSEGIEAHTRYMCAPNRILAFAVVMSCYSHLLLLRPYTPFHSHSHSNPPPPCHSHLRTSNMGKHSTLAILTSSHIPINHSCNRFDMTGNTHCTTENTLRDPTLFSRRGMAQYAFASRPAD